MDKGLTRSLFAAVVVLALAPVEATAQAASPLPSRLWLTAGAASATLHGDCQTCEADYPYRHDGSVLANAGYRVNPRMDVGAFIVPVLQTVSPRPVQPPVTGDGGLVGR